MQARKRQVGGAGHPPIIVAVVPLHDHIVTRVADLTTRSGVSQSVSHKQYVGFVSLHKFLL